MKTFLCGVAAAALLLTGCTPQAEVAQGPAKIAAGAKGPDGRINADPALWVLKDADTTIYLFGTVHVLRSDVDWFDDEVKRAYDASGELVLEMIQPEGAAAQGVIMAKATDPDGPALTAKLTPEAAAKYKAAMAQLGLPVAGFEGFEPWFVSTVMGLIPLQKLGYNPESGAEMILTKAAKATGKPLIGLETFEQQIGYFDNLPEPLQIRFLNITVDDLPELETKFAELISSWTRGDAVRLAALINEGLREAPEIGRILLTERNARWATWIDDRLDRPGTSFIAVGAGHLAGADSVQAMLAKRGFKVTRVQ